MYSKNGEPRERMYSSVSSWVRTFRAGFELGSNVSSRFRVGFEPGSSRIKNQVKEIFPLIQYLMPVEVVRSDSKRSNAME